MQLGHGLQVGAGAKKQRMTKRELPAKAPQDVPGLAQQGRIKRHHDEVQDNAGVRQ